MTWFLFALASAVLSAAAAVIQKKILFRILPLEFSFWVSVCILCMSLLAPLTVDVTAIAPTMLLIVVGKSILGAFAFLMVMLALQKNPISSALPLLGLTPMVTAVVSIPVLGESLGRWEWMAIGLMIAGTYVIERNPSQHSSGEPVRKGAVHAQWPILGALGLFALSSVADRMLVGAQRISPLSVLFYQHIIYCAVFGIALAGPKLRRTGMSGGMKTGAIRTLRDSWRASRPSFALIGIVALLTIAYRFAQLEATKDAPAALVLAVKRTSILFAAVSGGTLFHDERLTEKIIGALLITGSGFLILRFLA